MSHTEIQYLVALLAGLISGLLSEIGGAGSLISLPMLIGAGLPPIVANGTNRIGVMFQYTMGYVSFRAEKHTVPLREALILSIPLVAGTISGALFATSITEAFLNWTVIGFMILVITTTSIAPEIFSGDDSTFTPSKSAKVMDYLLLFGIGIYCGLVQSGMSYLMYYALVRRLNTNIVAANGMRTFMSMIVTPFALAIFIYNGHIDWIVGLFLAIGSGFGGWLGAIIIDKADAHTIKIILLVSLILSVIYMLIFIQLNFQHGIHYL